MKDFLQFFESLIPFLHPYPSWVKIFVAIWIIASAILIIALLFVPRSQRGVSKDAVLKSPPLQPIEQKNITETDQRPLKEKSLSFLQYYSMLDSFKDRFLEESEFLAKLKGKELVWKGYVYSVTMSENRLFLTVDATTNEHEMRKALVIFKSDMETKLFSLRKGDYVSFRGVYKGATTYWPDLEGLSLELVVDTKDSSQ